MAPWGPVPRRKLIQGLRALGFFSGYPVSQRKRKLVEEIFGWAKTVALLRKTRRS